MKCVVCGKDFPSGRCPRCDFPEILFPGDPEEGLRSLRPEIEAHRADFMRKIRVSAVAYRHHDVDGFVRNAGETELPFGTADMLSASPRWLDQPFARTDDAELDLCLRINYGADQTEARARVRQPAGNDLLRLGVTMDDAHQLTLVLRSESGGESRSDAIALLG